MTSSTPVAPTPAPPARPSPAVLVAMIVTVLAWASAFVVIRGVGVYFSGGALALARLLVGAVLLPLALRRVQWVKPSAREWVLLLGYGAGWFGAYNICLNIAEHSLDAGTTAMVVNIGPILIALGAWMFLGEVISTWLAVGATIAFTGVVLISLGAGRVDLASRTGVLLALCAAVAYTVGVLCQKVALRRIPAGQLTWLGCLAGVATCLPFAGDLGREVRTAPLGALAGTVYLGVVPTAIAFSAWSYALARLPAARLGVITYIVPVIVVLLGFVVFHEIPAPLAIVGGAIALGGVALSRRK